jgi:hypothetical protein
VAFSANDDAFPVALARVVALASLSSVIVNKSLAGLWYTYL